MAQKFTVPVTIKNLSSAGSDGLTVFLDQESFARLKVEAGGRITWGDGAGAGDTNLYRDAASVLKTDDTFKAAGLFVAGTQIDPASPTVGDALVYNGTKFVSASVASGSGNASLTVSDTPPVSPDSGDLWFESDTGKTFVYYDSFWVEVGSGGSTSTPEYLSGLNDVAFSSLSNGDFFRYNSSASVWTNDAINLSTDTIGDYVQSLVAGTGVSVTNNSGEGATPTISIGQSVGTTDTVTFFMANSELNGPVVIDVINNTGSTIAKGTPVYISGQNGGGVARITPADASDAAKMPAIGITQDALTDGSAGFCIVYGAISGMGTNGYSAGDILYIAPGGGFTTTRPSSPSHFVQTIGRVMRAHAVSGKILVMGAGRTNDVPNEISVNGNIIFEGATQDAYETTLTVVDPTADRTITLPNASGTVALNGSIALGSDTTGDYVASLVAGTGVTLTNNSGEGATPTVAIGQAVGTSSSVQFAGIRNTDFSNFGSNTFTKSTVGGGEIAIDNGTTDTPGLLMYYANNNNWGIDSAPISGNQSLRFVTNLNETGGTVRASIDASGNMVASTFRGTAAGSVLKDTMLDNSQITVVSTTAGATGSMVNFITYSYTPVSTSSHLIINIHISKYTMAGTTDDSWYSQINVDGSEIAYGWQKVNDDGTGTSGRSGVLFPLTGRYTNSTTTAKTIGIAARRDSADDSITIDNTSTAIWLRITEVAR